MRLTSLGREKLDVSRYCGMTLSNLACHRQNRVPVVRAGGLKPLCDMAFDGERLEMQRAAGLALYNLSCAAANQASYGSAGHRVGRIGGLFVIAEMCTIFAVWDLFVPPLRTRAVSGFSLATAGSGGRTRLYLDVLGVNSHRRPTV